LTFFGKGEASQALTNAWIFVMVRQEVGMISQEAFGLDKGVIEGSTSLCAKCPSVMNCVRMQGLHHSELFSACCCCDHAYYIRDVIEGEGTEEGDAEADLRYSLSYSVVWDGVVYPQAEQFFLRADSDEEAGRKARLILSDKRTFGLVLNASLTRTRVVREVLVVPVA
jgi:hypothetical protein